MLSVSLDAAGDDEDMRGIDGYRGNRGKERCCARKDFSDDDDDNEHEHEKTSPKRRNGRA